MSDTILGALIVGVVMAVINAVVVRKGHQRLLDETAKVHHLVNDHATKQDEKIERLQQEITRLRVHIAGPQGGSI